MKNLFKFVLAALCAFAFSASAQCITDPRVGRAPVVAGSGGNPCAPWGTPQPTGPAYYGGGYGSGTSVQYMNTAAQYGGGVRYGNIGVGGVEGVDYTLETRTRQCTPQEEMARRHRNGVGTAILGAIGGAAFGDNRNDVGRAAAAGLILGEVVSAVTECTVEYAVRVPIRRVVSNANPQQAAYNTAPVTKEVASRCAINGKVWRGLSETQCDELALELSKAKTVSAQNTAPQTETTPKSAEAPKAEAKVATFWGWFNPRSSESNPLTCFATKQISGMPPRCASVIVEPSQDGETENAWRERVKTLAMK